MEDNNDEKGRKLCIHSESQANNNRVEDDPKFEDGDPNNLGKDSGRILLINIVR